MDMEVKFRAAAMGYNKNDVNNYIEQITDEYQTKIKEKDDELSKLRNQMKELKNQPEEAPRKVVEDTTDDKTKIADVLIRAQSTAEKMIEEARQSAVEEKRKIEDEIEREREKLVDMKSELKKLKDSAIDTLKSFQKEVSSLVEE